MALWQFDLDFVDAAGGRDLSPAATALLRVELAQRFGDPQRMLGGWDCFGDKDGSRVDVVQSDDGSSEPQARVDARTSGADAFVTHVCEAATAIGYVFYCSELQRTLEPRSRQVKTALQESAAWSYALDSDRFVAR